MMQIYEQSSAAYSTQPVLVVQMHSFQSIVLSIFIAPLSERISNWASAPNMGAPRK